MFIEKNIRRVQKVALQCTCTSSS